MLCAIIAALLSNFQASRAKRGVPYLNEGSECCVSGTMRGKNNITDATTQESSNSMQHRLCLGRNTMELGHPITNEKQTGRNTRYSFQLFNFDF
ncbi:hypothetical protein QBC35DRAFT_482440 [Podospora australis]|uniref:Secreted protein n=1 Tax=Podospora australis TaxID=1536484 RepID=A0AAN6X3N0_9PEZI|nr:hypothetical protein QBC35DRAFT_482440 [Podospora australis]